MAGGRVHEQELGSLSCFLLTSGYRDVNAPAGPTRDGDPLSLQGHRDIAHTVSPLAPKWESHHGHLQTLVASR